jgi:hypothetical protein
VAEPRAKREARAQKKSVSSKVATYEPMEYTGEVTTPQSQMFRFYALQFHLVLFVRVAKLGRRFETPKGERSGGQLGEIYRAC